MISLLAVPASLVVDRPHRPPLAAAVRRPVGDDRRAQRPRRGDAHRARDREAVRAPGSRRSPSSTPRTSALYEASYRAQFLSGHHPARDEVHLEPQLRRDLRHRRPPGGDRPDEPRRRRRRSSSTRASSRSRSSRPRAIANVLQSAVASAERVFELLDEPEEIPDPVAPRVLAGAARARVAFEDVSFRYVPDKPLIEDLSTSSWSPAQTVAIVGPDGRRQDHAREPADALLRRRRRADHGRRRSTPAS